MLKDYQTKADLLKCMMDNMSDMIYFKDRDSKFIMVNKAAAEWQGHCSPEKMIGKSDFDFYSAEDARRMRDDELRIMQTGEPLDGLEEGETWQNGTHAWVSTTKMPLRNEADEIIGIFGISRDITEHKDAEIRAAKFAEENRIFREELEDDLLMAGELQKTFFPTSYPLFPEGAARKDSVVEFSHYHHAGGIVGGDLCSIRKLSEAEAGIFMCDVMGHGVRSALGTAIVHAMVEEISHQERSPGRFLQHMNQVLMPILRQGDAFLFSTACYIVLNVSDGTLRYANAGHPTPIILDADSGTSEWLVDDRSATGPALAIIEDFEYQTITRTIHPGDSVFMFTDGIYEVAGVDSEEFGEERLLAAARRHKDLSLQDLFPSLLHEVRQFAAEGEFDDDVCLAGFHLRDLLPA